MSGANPAGGLGMRLVRLAESPARPWRNGGGSTQELLAWPEAAAGEWSLRISVARIDRDGPFSAFPGTERWFAVIDGPGVVLDFGPPRRVLRGDAPLRFDGGAAPGCRLIDGPTIDLNLMLRGMAGSMQPVRAGQPWQHAAALRALYAAEAGCCRNAHGERAELPAGALLWTDRAAPDDTLSFDARGWWLAAEAQR